MNAIKLLKADHREFRQLFGSFQGSDSDQEKREIFKELKEKLEIHTHIEETVFYPKVIKLEGLEEVTKEGVEEHHIGDVLVREISKLIEGSEKFEPKMEVLIESVEHHLMEEEGEMFPKVEEQMSDAELEELGKRMKEEKQNFRKSQKASA